VDVRRNNTGGIRRFCVGFAPDPALGVANDRF